MNSPEVRQQDLRNTDSVGQVAQKIAPGSSGRSTVSVPNGMSLSAALADAPGLRVRSWFGEPNSMSLGAALAGAPGFESALLVWRAELDVP